MESTIEHPDGMKLDYLTFSPYDYALFGGMLVVSALVGVYFGCYKKQKTANDYLLGGRTMGVFPIATSLAASYISAITLLGMPAEVYTHGTQYAMSCFGGLFATVIIGYVFLPVFYELQLTSSYEYLELRFCKNVRLAASFIFLLDCIMIMPIVMYVPSLAFNLVTGIEIKFINPVVCLVCIFYTTLGGLKAVVWTDTIQFVTMNGAIFVILLLGISNEGGLTKIWTNAETQDRIHFFDFDLDPTKRVSFWTVTLGMCCGWISSLGVNQLCVQRFLSVPSMADAKKVLYIYSIVIAIIKALCLFSGLIMFSRYYGCDPLTAGVIARSDQILPYYVMDTTRKIPGLPGLFIAGVFSAALSSMSSILNTTSGVIYKDFICLVFPKEFTEKNASNIMKLIVVVVGTVTMSMVFIVEKLGSVLQVTISFSGVTNGAMLGVFVMGMIFPRANSKGTITGAFASVLFMSWMLYGNSMAISSGAVKYPVKSFAMDQCDSSINITSISSAVASEFEDTTPPEVYFLHRISFMWYSLMGTLTVFLVGLPVSYLTSPPSASQTKFEYFSPVVRNFLPDNIKQQVRSPKEEEAQYKQVDLLLYTTKENAVNE